MNKRPKDIEEIDERIKNFKTAAALPTDKKEKKFIYAYQTGSRVAAELVSGVLVGAGLGYLLDKMMDTSPVLLIIFLILGGAAGFLNVYRFVKTQEQKKG